MHTLRYIWVSFVPAYKQFDWRCFVVALFTFLFTIFVNTLYGIRLIFDIWWTTDGLHILATIRLANLCINVLLFVCFSFSSANWINSFLCQDKSISFRLSCIWCFLLLLLRFLAILKDTKLQISGCNHCVYVCVFVLRQEKKSQWKEISDHHEARRQVKIDIGSIINSFFILFHFCSNMSAPFSYSRFILFQFCWPFCCARHGKSFIHSKACRHHMHAHHWIDYAYAVRTSTKHTHTHSHAHCTQHGKGQTILVHMHWFLSDIMRKYIIEYFKCAHIKTKQE